MYNGIRNFTHNSTLKSKNLSRFKSRIKIYSSTELGTKKKKNECMSQRLNDLARPNVRRIRSIFEKQKKKSKFDMIKAEKLLKLINEPPKKPFNVKKCIEELAVGSKYKQARVTHARDKEYEKCRQHRDFQCLESKKVMPENQKLRCNNSFKPPKNLIDNYKKSFARPRTNFNVTNFNLSTEKYITTEEFERRCRNNNLKPSTFSKYNKTSENFVPKKPLSVDDNKVCQKSKNLQNVPWSLFVNHRNTDNNTRNMDYTGNVTIKHTENPKNIERNSTGTEKKAVKSNKRSIKDISKKDQIVDKGISSSAKPKEKVDMIAAQYTFDSGFDERIDSQNLTSFIANPKTSTAVTYSKAMNIDNQNFIEDPMLNQEIPNFLTKNYVQNSINHQQPVEFDSNVNLPNASSPHVDISSIADISPISHKENRIVSSIQEEFEAPKSNQIQKYSYPDIYENFSISLLSENDSNVIKFSNNSTNMDRPQSLLTRQFSFKKKLDILDFGTIVAKQDRNLSQLPVIALRDFNGYHDVGIDKDNEILVRVTSANFDKIYVVTKINDERNLKEFCKSSVSSRSKLFLLNNSKEIKEIQVKKFGTKSYCGKEHKEAVEDFTKNSLLSSIKYEKFSVQKLDKTSKNPGSKGINIHVTENSDKNSNFTVVKEQNHM